MHQDEDQLRNKELAGDPATAERAKVRNQCKPKGPTGFLLESIHMQAATLNENLTIQQWDQQDVEIIKGPTQMIAPLVRKWQREVEHEEPKTEDSRPSTSGKSTRSPRMENIRKESRTSKIRLY